ncbi:hypothetical protein PF010_g20218 [Phytophthora fragariae]|uniref:Uncharacterized protein n=1 Tax=Phytophthora fragariae TaxID=53985 RepID=A0A6A3SB25_9STRA|nr:hypothetical protein PF009_g21813 [Phytophthora fragariae]KAE9012466.1 hypothetical protein PF011_g8907 [Phytophthora fragariae]KAE9086104.1 hypothetical protein PF010_g20218 [Phytophthora fragariae]KAE9113397.1 hypothetical protein PF006_g19754 [Phytophthora fragariae]
MDEQATTRAPEGARALGMTELLTSQLPLASLSSMSEILTAPSPRDLQLPVVGDKKYMHQGVELTRRTAASIKGISVGGIRHGELRAICKVLAVPGYKNKNKATMAHLITLKKLNEEVYDIMFSPPSKKSRSHNKQEYFIGTSDEHIGKLQFSHFALDEMDIDPSVVVPHGWKKLANIYADTAKGYKDALALFTASGNHQPEFYHFCGGQLDVLYLHLHLAHRPSLTGHVQADLPDGAFFDSESKSPAPTPEKPKRKTKSSGPSVAEAITEYVRSTIQSDNAVQRLLFMQKRDEREEAKDKRDQMKAEQEMSLLRFQEWTRISDRMRALRRELQHEEDPEIISDLTADIEQLKRKKDAINFI